MKSLLSKDEKTKLLETFRSSGQTQAAFAEVNGINPKTLARWIYQQRLEAGQNQNNVEFVELKRTVVKIRQGIIIRKAGIEIEMPSFAASSLKEILKAVNLTYAKLTELRSLLTGNYIRLWKQKLKEILLSDFFFLQKRLSEPCA